MNRDISPTDRLDQACEQFIDEFSLDFSGFAPERSATVDNLPVGLALGRLALTYRTQEEQQAFFETADNNQLTLMGNPSAHIQTWTNDNRMATYNFDRTTGLVVVNNFPFPSHEVRALRARDAKALEFSIATRGISSSLMNRALTDEGINRLAMDLQTAIEEVK